MEYWNIGIMGDYRNNGILECWNSGSKCMGTEGAITME